MSNIVENNVVLYYHLYCHIRVGRHIVAYIDKYLHAIKCSHIRQLKNIGYHLSSGVYFTVTYD